MEFEQAQRLAEGLMRDHGLLNWKLGWNRRKRTLGLCRYRERRIELSVYFVNVNGVEEVKETILHEIAHALAGEDAGHGAHWRAMCIRVGCRPERCAGNSGMPQGQWSAQCGSCGREFSRHRRPKPRGRYWCRQCGPERGSLTFELRVELHGPSEVA